jgi:hypothetical protein
MNRMGLRIVSLIKQSFNKFAKNARNVIECELAAGFALLDDTPYLPFYQFRTRFRSPFFLI